MIAITLLAFAPAGGRSGARCWAAGTPGAPAAAPETVTLAVTDAGGAPGDVVTFTVGLTSVIGVDSLAVVKLCLAMDPTVLTPVAAARAPQLAGVPDDGFNATFGPGSVCISAASPVPLPIGVGPLFTIDAVVGPLARAGDTTGLDIVDQPGNLVLLLRTVDETGDGVKHLNQSGLFTASGGVVCTAGDVNDDGAVNSGDAVLALRIAVELVPDPSIAMLCGADANRDRLVNSGDAVWILRRTVGLPKDAAGWSGTGGTSSAPPLARVAATSSGGVLEVEGAAGLYGLDLDVVYDPQQLVLGDLSGPGSGVGAGLYVEREARPGTRWLRWAAAEPLDAVGDGVLRLPLPAAARAGAGARLAITRLQGFDAGGAPVAIAWAGDSELVLTAGGGDTAPPAAAARPRLLACAPNPFNPSTMLRFTVPRAGHVLLQIHDASGALVTTLVDRAAAAGDGQVLWNGTDGVGRQVASGVYFARLRAPGASDVLRLVLVK